MATGGSMEVRCMGDGYTLVNSLPLERYLQDVVPSEMPASYEPEALKAQAVCARSMPVSSCFGAIWRNTAHILMTAPRIRYTTG